MNATFPLKKIRLSSGSASVLGLLTQKLDALPTTCYIMTYTKERCIGRCSFCPQGTGSDPKSDEQLSRIQWPVFSWKNFEEKAKQNQNSNNPSQFKRFCIQVLNYHHFIDDVIKIVDVIHQFSPKTAISAAIPPISKEKMQKLKNVGLERIGIALDASTPKLFAEIKGPNNKGPYSWKKHWKTLENALDIFGSGKVTTHLIVGLGETEVEMIQIIHKCVQKNIQPGIFLFTPIHGTPMANFPRPTIIQFRHIQIARQMMLNNNTDFNRFEFNSSGELNHISKMKEDELWNLIRAQNAFKTAGCPDCNRPYYTSRPGEEQDGYPKDITPDHQKLIYHELKDLIK
ncbi:MAG: radical SAM protein [Promethearchaeota archaeon]